MPTQRQGLDRLIQAVELAEQLLGLEDALAAGLATVPGLPPLPGLLSWGFTQQQLMSHAETLNFDDLHDWGVSASPYVPEDPPGGSGGPG